MGKVREAPRTVELVIDLRVQAAALVADAAEKQDRADTLLEVAKRLIARGRRKAPHRRRSVAR